MSSNLTLLNTFPFFTRIQTPKTNQNTTSKNAKKINIVKAINAGNPRGQSKEEPGLGSSSHSKSASLNPEVSNPPQMEPNARSCTIVNEVPQVSNF
ncbi:hypothetical protein BB559_003002 [Furculomyces boomerangus]|uniref:Uncharacterized protein n=1 Tax=Furculomyces boomerangus TaxID=61424 RepID=A0A2T9YQF2_9FUNG|nr:hypothetical protein BB559_003002 [Furculomyces boomerangus]